MSASRARMASWMASKSTVPEENKQEASGLESGSEGDPGDWVKAGKSKKPPGKKTTSFICKGGHQPCGNRVKDEEDSIECDGCHSWFHPKCQKVTQEVFKFIGKNKILWLCHKCSGNVEHLGDMEKYLTDMEKRIETRIMESEQRILKALESVHAAKNIEGQIDAKLKKMEKSVVGKIQEQNAVVTSALGEQKEVAQATQKTYAEIAQTMKGKQPSDHAIVNQLGGKLDEVLKEREEIEKRKLNLVIHGLPETNMEGNNIQDPVAFSALCTEYLKIEEVVVESMVRLGPKSPPKERRSGESKNDRPWIRPLKVTLKDNISKYKILRAAPALRDIERGIYITPDKTPKQREDEVKLRETCKKYNEEHKDQDQEAYIHRGEMAFRERRRK